MNPDLNYHRGHTWVREEKDGLLTIGLDEFASRCLGDLDEVILPPVGTKLVANGHGFDIQANNGTGSKQLGLIGMQERAESVGGHLETFSGNNLGTRVMLTVPLAGNGR